MSARLATRMLERRCTVACAACGERVRTPLSFGERSAPPSRVAPCPEHPDFGLFFVFDADGELSIRGRAELDVRPFPPGIIELLIEHDAPEAAP